MLFVSGHHTLPLDLIPTKNKNKVVIEPYSWMHLAEA